MTDETLARARALAEQLARKLKVGRTVAPPQGQGFVTTSADDLWADVPWDEGVAAIEEYTAAIEQPLQQQIATLDLRRRHLETVNSEIAEAQEAAEDALRRTEQELADAAHEINCAGPIAHRIRVFKQEVDMALRESRARVEQLEQALKDVDRANSHQGAGPHCTCSQRERERIISAALASLAEATADGQKGK
jgi:chromosome segregation ATPase